MAKLVIGSNKQNGVPAIVKEVVIQPSLGTKNITTNGTYNASGDNYDGYSSVTVNVPQPSGSTTITTNGTHDVTNYASAVVNVPTVSEPYLELEIQSNGNLAGSRTTSRLVSLSGFTGMNPFVLAGAYYGNTNISGPVEFSNLASLLSEASCYETFYGTRVSSFSAPSLTRVSGDRACHGMFTASQITTVNLSNLEVVSGQASFYGCFQMSRVNSVNLSSLQTVSNRYDFGRAFYGCSYLTTMTFPALIYITGTNAFDTAFGNSAITSLSFPALKSDSFGTYTNQFHNMLTGVTGCTVHFPSNLQSVIGSWSDVTNGFGGTNTTVLFDLAATE